MTVSSASHSQIAAMHAAQAAQPAAAKAPPAPPAPVAKDSDGDSDGGRLDTYA